MLNHALDVVYQQRALHCVLHVVHSHMTPLTLRYLTEIQVSYLHTILLYYIVRCVNTMIITINDLLAQHVVTCIGHLQVIVEHSERFWVDYCSYIKL